jgi:hypothetical protein
MENGKPRKRRQLSPEEKWEIFLEVTSQELTQADCARRQSTWRQRRASSSGPLTTTSVAPSSLSFGSGISVIFLLTGSPDHVSALSSPGTRPDIRPVIRNDRRRGQPSRPGFLLPFGHRHSLLGHPTPAKGSALLTVGPPTHTGPDPDGVTALRTYELRPGWVPPVPRGRRCSSRTEARSQPAPAAPPWLVPKPRHNIPPCEAPLHEASNRGSSRSPVRSSPRPRHRDGTSDASASPRAPHPAVTSSARQGQGQAIEHGPGTTRSHFSDPPIRVVHSCRATSRRTAL